MVDAPDPISLLVDLVRKQPTMALAWQHRPWVEVGPQVLLIVVAQLAALEVAVAALQPAPVTHHDVVG